MGHIVRRASPLLVFILLIVSTIAVTQALSTADAVPRGLALNPHSLIHVYDDAELGSLIASNHWNGTGSADDPYIIENLDINASGSNYGMYISGTDAYLVIRNCSLHNADIGISSSGLFLSHSDNVTVFNNTFTNNGVGIHQGVTSGSVTIENNTFSGNYYGIEIINANGAALVSNNFSGNNNDIYVQSASGNLIAFNLCNNMVLYTADNNWIANNTCINDSDHGIRIVSSSGNVVVNNTCACKTPTADGKGIWLESSNDNIIENNDCYDCTYGIRLDNSNRNTLDGNPCGGNENGIWLTGSDENIITNNTCAGNTVGVCLTSSSGYNRISGNDIRSNDHGIELESSDHDVVSENTLIGNVYEGVVISGSNHTAIMNNSCRSSVSAFLVTDNSRNNTLENNSCHENGNGIRLHLSGHNVLRNNDLTGNTIGINLESSHVNEIIGNNCSGNVADGIFLTDSSENNTLSKNTCSGATNGIAISGSGNNTVSNNNCSDNTIGMSISSSGQNNTIDNNTVANNDYGIYFSSSGNNTVSNNTISGNSLYGIYLFHNSDRNLLFGNLLIMNHGSSTTYSGTNVQAYDDGPNNHWDLTGSGNFWCDWSSPDDDHDGIVDVPYDITGPVKDWFPLALERVADISVTIISPVNGSITNVTNMFVSWNVSDSFHIVHRNVSVDGIWMTVQGTSLSLLLDEGHHTVAVNITDILGAEGRAMTNFTVDITPPSLVITAPSNGSLIASHDVRVNWTAIDIASGIANCEVQCGEVREFVQGQHLPAGRPVGRTAYRQHHRV